MPLSEEDIKWIVRRTLAEERREYEEEQDATVTKTVLAILKSVGVDSKEEAEIKEDFRYLRKWRQGADKVKGLGLTALVTLFVGGTLSALWLGMKSMMGKP